MLKSSVLLRHWYQYNNLRVSSATAFISVFSMVCLISYVSRFPPFWILVHLDVVYSEVNCLSRSEFTQKYKQTIENTEINAVALLTRRLLY